MGAALHGDPHSLFSLEKLPQIFFPGSDLAGFHGFTILVQPAVMAPPVADIDAHRTVRLSFFGLRFFDTLLHKAGLLLHLRMRCGQHHSLFRETSRLIPSKVQLNQAFSARLKSCPVTNRLSIVSQSTWILKCVLLINTSFSASCRSRTLIQVSSSLHSTEMHYEIITCS